MKFTTFKAIKTTTLATATLLASGLAAAQTVQLNGVVDAFAGQRQLSGRAKLKTLDSGGMTTSRWGVEGSEDLGGGLKASFALSGFLRADTGEAGRFGTADGGWRRFAFVGLQGAFGSLRLGRVGTPTFGVAIRFSPFADSTTLSPYALHMYTGGQPLAAPMNSPDSAADNTLAYSSPNLGGFSLTGLYSPGESSSQTRRYSAGGNWSSGRLAASVALEQTNVAGTLPTGVSSVKNVQAGVSYDLGVAKLFAQFGSTDLDFAGGTRAQNTWQLGSSLPWGQGAVLLSYAHSEKQEPGMAEVTRGTLGLGYDHSLSKRTDVYAVYLNDKVSGLAKGDTLVAGIRHRF